MHIYCERSELSGLFNGTDFLYIIASEAKLAGEFNGISMVYVSYVRS